MWNRTRQIILSDAEKDISKINFQKERILNAFKKGYKRQWILHHDADFYFILIRRLYRQIETESVTISKVANLKGKYKDLFKKIKIRDSYEHNEDLNLPSSNLKIVNSVMVNLTSGKITMKVLSGIYVWDLAADHEQFLKAFSEYIQLKLDEIDVQYT